jgi:hypothetical protein
MNVTYSTTMTRLCQLSSRVAKRLSNAHALRQSPEELANTIQKLDQELIVLKSSLQDIVHLDTPINPSRLVVGISAGQAMSIQSMYYGMVFDIHTPLTYPWSRGIPSLSQLPNVQSQVEASSAIVADTSRKAIMASTFVQPDANCSIQ